MEYHTEVGLEALAEADPCSLADAPRLRAVYSRVLDADSHSGALDDVARLHALFDVALDNGLVSVVVHYVQEVSSLCLRPVLCACALTPRRQPGVPGPAGGVK
jgi:hypothetical protein